MGGLFFFMVLRYGADMKKITIALGFIILMSFFGILTWNYIDTDESSEVSAPKKLSNKAIENFGRQPHINSSKYQIEYVVADNVDLSSSTTVLPNKFWPIEMTVVDKDGKVIADNLFSDMFSQISVTLEKEMAYPYSFTENNTLIFGGTNYEGTLGQFYIYRLDKKRFDPLNLKVDDVYGYFDENISPNGRYAIYFRDNSLLVFDFENMSRQDFDADISQDETLAKECGMGCNGSGNWIDNQIFQYDVYNEGNQLQLDHNPIRKENLKL